MEVVSPGRTVTSRAGRLDLSEVFAPSEFDGTLEAALLLKKTGITLGSWTRGSVPREIVSVMAATMWGSLDTMIRTFGGKPPRSAYLELEDRQMLAMHVEPNWILLVVAPSAIGKRRLRREAQQILERIARMKGRRARSSSPSDVQG